MKGNRRERKETGREEEMERRERGGEKREKRERKCQKRFILNSFFLLLEMSSYLLLEQENAE